MNIIEHLKVQCLLGVINTDGKSYLSFNPDEFKHCEDYPRYKALKDKFGVSDCILVNFSDDMPMSILEPLIWKLPEKNCLVYRIGNDNFEITADKTGIKILNDISLHYDTKEINKNRYLYFSFNIDEHEFNASPIYKDSEGPETPEETNAFTDEVKSFIRRKKYQQALDFLSKRIKEVPRIRNVSTISEVFRPFLEDGKFQEISEKLGGKFAVLLQNPRIVNDKYGVSVEFDFDAKAFTEKIEDNVLVKSWGKFKELSTIDSISFKHHHINDSYLKDICAKKIQSDFCVLIITSINPRNPEWPPLFTLISDTMINSNESVKKVMSSMLGGVTFPEKKEPKQLPQKDENPLSKALDNFSFN